MRTQVGHHSEGLLESIAFCARPKGTRGMLIETGETVSTRGIPESDDRWASEISRRAVSEQGSSRSICALEEEALDVRECLKLLSQQLHPASRWIRIARG